MKPPTLTGADLPSLRHIMSVAWREEALCAPLPKEVFFDYGSKRDGDMERKKANRALAIETCRACPVSSECYEFAVKNNEPYGIWSGTFPNERKQLYKDYISTGVFTPKTPETV